MASSWFLFATVVDKLSDPRSRPSYDLYYSRTVDLWIIALFVSAWNRTTANQANFTWTPEMQDHFLNNIIRPKCVDFVSECSYLLSSVSIYLFIGKHR